ncbi:hypothetical protein [Pantoea agglomerans]|uniref:hypothetical protein n=1 Tax=Enterobacter agglomerans TaxID=549 RepID=UPI003FD0B91E
MAKPWKQVIASPQFQALSPEQKAAAQNQYFDEVVAPQAGGNSDAARQAFFSAYPTAATLQEKPEALWQQAGSPNQEGATWGDAPKPTRGQQIASGAAETGRAILQAGVNVANIPAEITDSIVSAGAWLGNKVGLGDGTYSAAPRLTTAGIESALGLDKGTLTPQSDEGRIFAEALPYLTPVGLERMATAAPTVAERIANLGARLTAENVTGALAANSGTDPDGTFVGDLATGVAAGGVVGGLAKGVSAAARSFGQRGVQEAGDGLRNIVTQGRQASPMEETARAVSESPDKSILRSRIKIELPGGGDSASVTPQLYRAAEEVRPDQSILDAAERVGVRDQLLPSHYSKNPTYQAIEQGLKSVPASQLAAQEASAISTLAQKTDDLIAEAGGTQNRIALSDKFKAESSKAIDELSKRSDSIYSEISRAISPRTPATAEETVNLLKNKAGDLGGEENLSSAERMVMRRLSGKSIPGADGTVTIVPPTYALLDNTRKQIGAAISRGEGPFKDQTTAELKQLYSAITADQEKVAAAHGMGDKWGLAKSLVAQRKGLEEHMVYALGKDLSGTFASKLSPAIQGLRKGNTQSFDKLIAATPAGIRQEVVASALNDVFTLGSRKEAQLHIPGFVDWYSGTARNGALERVTKHLPSDAQKRLHDLYTVARGIRAAKSNEISTGRIQSLLDQFDKNGGMVSKIYDVGKKAAAAEGVTSAIGFPGAGSISVIVSTITRNKTARTVAADRLIASHEFRNATRLMAGADAIRLASAKGKVEQALKRSRQYQGWASTLQPSERQAIAKVGLLDWLNKPDE